MFFLETKDGDRFFTEPKSNDKLEFEKIIESKLGKDAAEMFDILVDDGKAEVEHIMESAAERLNDCINDFDGALNSDTLDRIRLEDILSELQSLYNMIN